MDNAKDLLFSNHGPYCPQLRVFGSTITVLQYQFVRFFFSHTYLRRAALMKNGLATKVMGIGIFWGHDLAVYFLSMSLSVIGRMGIMQICLSWPIMFVTSKRFVLGAVAKHCAEV